MTTSGALQLFRDAVLVAAQVAGPALTAALAVGIMVGVLQTATQVNEPSVSFLVKLLAVVGAFGLVGPYAVTKLVEYARTTISTITEIVR